MPENTALDERADWITMLARLLPGAHVMLDSAAAWKRQLAGDSGQLAPVAARFVAALDAEWLPAPAPDAYCADLARRVQRHLSVWHPGWPHLWAHIQRVTGTALALAEEAGIDPAVVYLMCMVHDVAKLDEYRTGTPHEDIGAAFAGRVLSDRLSPGTIAAIQAAIFKTGQDALARILNDADRLDKVGAAGIVRRTSTDMRWSWLAPALWRVANDDRKLAPMAFTRSAALLESKRALMAWFLPAAEHWLELQHAPPHAML